MDRDRSSGRITSRSTTRPRIVTMTTTAMAAGSGGRIGFVPHWLVTFVTGHSKAAYRYEATRAKAAWANESTPVVRYIKVSENPSSP
jgi:hypothetical protein